MRTLVLGGRGAVGRVVVVRRRARSCTLTDIRGRHRMFLRADFPDHLLVGVPRGALVRSHLAMSSPAATAALAVASYAPGLRGVVSRAPHLGSDEWSVVAIDRSTGRRVGAWGRGQSRTTGLLTALVAVRAAEHPPTRPVTTADVLTLADVRSLPEISVAEHC